MDIFVKPSLPLVKYLKVLMISVYENNKDVIDEEGITFWCLHNALEDRHKAEIKEIADRYNQKVEFIFVDVNIFNGLPSASPWPQTIYFGLLAHQFLPESLHRVLYLDIDVAVNGNIKEFYNLPFDDNYLIASRDWYDARYEPEEEFKEFTYLSELKEADLLGNGAFNCGVLLFNLDKFREDKIDIEFYEEKLNGKKVKLADQSILSYCFYNKTKLLTTCKYNYRIGYSLVSMRQWKSNYYFNRLIHYEYSHIIPIIVHYAGQIGFKPWYLYFSAGEIDINRDFNEITPEYADYIEIWWKYARLSPDYDNLWSEQHSNKIAYDIVKKLIKNKPAMFANSMRLATLTIPDLNDRNTFRKNEDINRYARPGIYACTADISPTIKNLPSELNAGFNFRLTVKTLSVLPSERSSLVQELEVADECATLYRRYAKNRDVGWSPWVKIVSTYEVKKTRLAKESPIGVLKDDITNEIKAQQNSLLAIEEKVSKTNKECIEQINKLQEDIRVLNLTFNEQNKKITEQLSAFKLELEDLRNSKSYKLGRFLTFIPRKVRDMFKKKK